MSNRSQERAGELAARQRDRLAELVAEESGRRPVEKETGIRFDKTTDRATVTTHERGLCRRFLLHPSFNLKWVTADRDGSIHRVTYTELESVAWARVDAVVSVAGTIPVGCLTISTDPRATGGHAEVVSRAVLDTQGGTEE